MEGLFHIIKFAAESGWNLFAVCAVFFAIGLSLGLPLSALGPFVTLKEYNVKDMSNKEENK